MKYGIVGSRKRQCRQEVIDFVASLPPDSIIVSGGCRGVDTWAADAARARGLGLVEFLPDLPPRGSAQHEFTKAFYARNLQIAQECDVLVAWVAKDRKGGTENTIKYAQKLRKAVCIR